MRDHLSNRTPFDMTDWRNLVVFFRPLCYVFSSLTERFDSFPLEVRMFISSRTFTLPCIKFFSTFILMICPYAPIF